MIAYPRRSNSWQAKSSPLFPNEIRAWLMAHRASKRRA
jgi:hypothetical protein